MIQHVDVSNAFNLFGIVALIWASEAGWNFFKTVSWGIK